MLILNGDTFFRIDLNALSSFHTAHQADCSLCLKPMQDFDRFGVVELDAEGRVKQFREKQAYRSGLINGGVYALDRESFLREELRTVFSFEKDYLEKMLDKRRLFGLNRTTISSISASPKTICGCKQPSTNYYDQQTASKQRSRHRPCVDGTGPKSVSCSWRMRRRVSNTLWTKN